MTHEIGSSSPEATTSAILGASSAGWSPIRTAKRPIMGEASSSSPHRDSISSTVTGSDAGASSPNVPAHRANIAVLRSHGLVSNSIFKSGNASPTHSQASNASPRGSPTRADMSRVGGVGLGIRPQAPASPSRQNGSSARTASNSSIDSLRSTSDAENDPPRSIFKSASPRKTYGTSKLEKASCVSNSPFRKQTMPTSEVMERPLELPNNAWAASASARSQAASPTRERPERVNGVPRTPERTPQRYATAVNNGEADFDTPNSQNGTPRGTFRGVPSAMDSPSNRGLLVSNRLHGPRLMEAGSNVSTPQESPSRRERRKTVTFDEVLDVQEFDRESSFDGHSLQSGSSIASSLNSGYEAAGDGVGSPDQEMWLNNGASKVVEKLMVVNGSPESLSSAFSTPDLESSRLAKGDRQLNHQHQSSDIIESSSTDSRELSSVDEPRSPPAEEVSLEYEHGDKSYNTAPDVSYFNETVYVDHDSDLSGGNLSAYGALHRVDSLVDELLGGDLLGQGQKAPQGKNSSESPPRRRKAGGVTLGEQERTKPLPNVPQPLSAQPSTQVQLSLPSWSPLMSSHVGEDPAATNEAREVEAELQVAPARKAAPVSPSKPAGRPHISRDAVLQRVAREKEMQEEQKQGSKSPLASKEEGVPAAKSQTLLATRRSEGSAIVTRSASGTIIAPKAPTTREEKIVTPPLAQPATAAQVSAEQLASPLERLGAEVAAEQEQAAENNMAATTKPMTMAGSASTQRQERWFDDSRDSKWLHVNEQSLNDASSGRLSPSVAGADVPKLTPAQQAEQIIARRRSKNGKSTFRPKSRRSLSDGNAPEGGLETIESMERVAPIFHNEDNEAELRAEEMLRNRHLLDASLKGAIDSGFETGLEREISRIYHQGEQKYKINDRGVFTSNPATMEEKVTHNTQAGDVDGGKAWKKLRRPSDMNEYAKEMREYRENENPKKAAGKVFVLVDSFVPSSLPVPNKPTRFYCVLDNGLHVVKTATAALRPGSAVASKIGQEFELIQHKNLEFSLTLMVQRDAHLQEPQPESPTNSRKMTPSFSRGMGKLFSSPKKRAAFASSNTASSMASSMSSAGTGIEPMLSYINKEGAFGRCDVVFEKVAQQCLAKCLVLDIPVRGVNDPAPSLSSSMHKTSSIDFSKNVGKIRGTLRLKLFYLPPMPSVPRNLMPQNLGDCIRGMEAARWHSGEAWMEGTLTQLGGDCVSWRRRPVKAQGAHLIGYNEITKKPTIKIDLRKAISIEQSHDPVKNSNAAAHVFDDEEIDETYHVERSFRLTFKDGEKIHFFADTDEEMQSWMEALKKVVGNSDIPANCVWASVAMEMVKSAKEKSASGKQVEQSKRVPVRMDAPTATPQKAGPMPAAPSSLSTSTQATPTHRIPRIPAPNSLESVPETATPEETPTRRRPGSVIIPRQQLPRQVSNHGPFGAERPMSVYVDGRS